MSNFYAFPFQANDKQNPGMTMRDYFAGQALAGLMANPKLFERHGSEWFVKGAYTLADAMLEEAAK